MKCGDSRSYDYCPKFENELSLLKECNAPEKPTLIERFLQPIPVRHLFGALAWAIILGTPGYHLIEYTDHERRAGSKAQIPKQ